ncbi:MAG: M28 family peptidase [Bacteroidia bacterium]|nr:M28 family peptidase [Bacteroidia bacterium]
MRNYYFFFLLIFFSFQLHAQESAPPNSDSRIFDIVDAVSEERIEQDIRKLVSFGTRHTLSDTVSTTRGIGAARRWIKSEFEKISADCGGCLKVSYQFYHVEGNPKSRIKEDAVVVNVLATLTGSRYPNRYVIMSGDIDSRVSDPLNATDESPGANDNATGMAGVLEAARVLSQYKFPTSVIFVGLSGEEQGLFGGKHMAQVAKDKGWNIVGVLNNDMIGNIEGIDGVIQNNSFRVFSEIRSPQENENRAWRTRFYGGEVDGLSRQLARYVDRMTDQYIPNLDAMMIYRLDRFGRGGHHRPFNEQGFPGVRIMETHENYNRQHQDLRTENGIKYGDVIEGVNFPYCAKLTAVNAIVLAGLAWAPPQPKRVRIGGIVKASTVLSWEEQDDPNILGYKVYWRLTTDAQWTHSVFVGNKTRHTLKNIVIDNYFFGVATVGKDGNESVVSFPQGLIMRGQ